MSIYFISDLHLGHKNILNFSPNRYGDTPYEHDEYQISQIYSTIGKKDVLYILGDVAFEAKKLELLRPIRGRMILVRGNHDTYPLDLYREFFVDVLGFAKYKEFWLSHAPIHPEELRGKKNIHGHVHMMSIPDDRYINVCADVLKDQCPISLEQIRANIKPRFKTEWEEVDIG